MITSQVVDLDQKRALAQVALPGMPHLSSAITWIYGDKTAANEKTLRQIQYAIAEYWEDSKITLKGKVIGRARQPGQRGQQKTPTKEAVSIRLSPEVLEYFRSTGKGWQTRIDDILREYVKLN